MSWKLDKKNTTSYLEICQRAVDDEETFANFRQMDPINMIIENSPEKSGREYWNCINDRHPRLLPHFDKFQTSDDIGNPAKMFVGDYVLSPSTLRYIKTLGDLDNFFGSLSGMTIAEIGAGYGGLCKIIHDVYTPADYHIFDLPEPIALQKKFLSSFGINPITDEYPDEIDLLIAMYSWSELSEELQVEYLNKVIKKAKNCYIMLNYDMDSCYQLLMDAFPSANISDWNIFYNEQNTEYAPYNRFIIIKN